MSTATLGGFLEHLRDGRAGGFASLTDGELVACFQAGRDEEAFAAILRRHGPMVLRVCRRVLRREEDAEDAFQATFLVLARRAGTLRNRASLASFLHGVAHRVSLEALDADARRRKHETRAAPRPPAADHEDLRTTLDEEVRRLPDRLRGPLVLWLLEGQTQDEVARQLGLSSSTCRRNLDRGRELLAARLTRRGVTLSAGALAALLAEGSANAALPALSAASARVLNLTEKAVRTMWMKTWITVAALTFGCLGLAGVAYRSVAVAEAPAEKAASKGGKAKADPRLKSILAGALKDAEAIKEPFDRAVAFGSIAKLQARTGAPADAADTLRRALEAEEREGPAGRQHRDNRLWILAEYQAETGDDKGALETVKGGVSAMNRDHALCLVASALAKGGKVKAAQAALDEVRDVRSDGVKNEALSSIVSTLAEAGDVKGAAEVAGRIRAKSERLAVSQAAIAHAHARAGRRDAAGEWLAKAKESGELAPRKDFALVFVAEVQAALGQAEDARATIATIKDPQSQDYTRQLVAVALAGRGDLKAARAVADEITTPPMQGEARKAIVVALLRAKDLAAASKAADAVADDAGRCFALMELAKGFAAASRRDEAKRVLDAATDLADRLESPKGTRGVREAALAFAAGARAAAGDVDAALAWAKKHEDASVRTMAQVRIAEALAPRR